MARGAIRTLLAAAGTVLASPSTPSATGTPSFLFILADDIGWADFRYNNGTAVTPRISEWVATGGTVTMQDFHSGGTVCSPTRATVLTGRNHFRDCVHYVYGCSDMTECVPDFEFAPQRTYTIGDAVRAANRGYKSWFGGKWHLGSFYNDSEAFGGRTSSPIWHGFDHMNATVEVAPTATTNCECNAEWQKDCNYGHYEHMTHCSGSQGPDPDSKPGCCFNYWTESQDAAHGVTNLTNPSPDDDATYLADSFIRFAESRNGAPFLAQISFHNCHVPFIGTKERVDACNTTSGEQCNPPLPGADVYNFEELDFYACLNELDNSVGVVLDALKRLGYYDNTMIWFTTDNGPEVNCKPEGRCGSGNTGQIPPGTLHRPDCGGASSAGPLRGRKRDVWEGGHRVPGIISWPQVVGNQARVSWDPVVTMDFLATIMEVLSVKRPESQEKWHFDGVSVMPILKGETPAPRGIGWMYELPTKSSARGYAFRYGKWKYVAGGISCDPDNATFNCSKPQLYDMETDYAENNDLADQMPDVLAAIAQNFTVWYNSIQDSRVNESMCSTKPPPKPPQPFPKNFTPSDKCIFFAGKALKGNYVSRGSVKSKEACCGACLAFKNCSAADFRAASRMHPTFEGVANGGTCHLWTEFSPEAGTGSETAMQVPP